MMRIRVRWSGYQGGPGYNVFHFAKFGQDTYTVAEAEECRDRLRSMFDAIKLYLPNAVKIDIMGDVDIIQENNAELLDVLAINPQATITGTAGAGAQFAAAAGAVMTWRTQTVRNGRRMRGRSFIVPLANTGFSVDGTLDTGLVNLLNTHGALIASNAVQADLVVYGRPTPILDAQGNRTGDYNEDGIAAFVQGVTVPDMSAVLKSRRD